MTTANKNQTQSQNRNTGLLNTSVDIDPVAVIYNVTNDIVEQFVYEYLHDAKGIEGVIGVRSSLVRSGQRPEISIYVFLRMDSKDVSSQMQNVPKILRNKMDVGGYRASDRLFDAMKALVGRNQFRVGVKGNTVYIKIDIFRALGMVLGANPNRQQITINEVQPLKKKRFVMSVVKSNKFLDKADTGGGDRLHDIIDSIER